MKKKSPKEMSTAQPAAKFTVSEAVAALEMTSGIVGPAARLLRCQRHELAAFIEQNHEVASAKERIEAETVDLAFSNLVKSIFDSRHPDLQWRSINLLLRNIGKDRGFTSGVQVEPKDRVSLEAGTKLDLSMFSAAELAVLKKAALMHTQGARP